MSDRVIVLPPSVMKELMANIVEATHCLQEWGTGAPAQISTLDPKALRIAAIQAIQTALGEQVWAGDQILKVKINEARRVGQVQFD